jgi:DNA-directed RNA polymerase specialized sigma24 family protein
MEYKEDKHYIGRVLKGEANAYAFLVNKYKSMAYSLALKLIKNREDAEEIAQDAFIKAYQNCI